MASSILRRGIAMVAAAGAILGIRGRIATAAVPAGGFLNHPLVEAEKSGFFNWFNLRKQDARRRVRDSRRSTFVRRGPSSTTLR